MHTGEPVGEYKYDAWGNIIEHTNNDVTNANPFRYRGYYYDTESGFYYLNSRYYDPQTGRFINADDPAILFESAAIVGGVNLFAYCSNNPVMLIDPNGDAWWHWVVGAVIIVAGAVVTAATAGTGASFVVAFGAALLKSVIQVGVSMAISTGVGGLVSVYNGGGFFDNVGDSLASGFMWAGIFAGGAQLLSAGFKGVATVANKFDKLQVLKRSPIFSPNRLKDATEIAKILAKGQKFYDYGGTLVRFDKFAHIDVSTKAFLHLAAFGYKHLPVGVVLSGIIGGLS